MRRVLCVIRPSDATNAGGPAGPLRALMAGLARNGFAVETLAPPATDAPDPAAFRAAIRAAIDRFRPDVLITSDDGPIGRAALAEAREQGVATAFLVKHPDLRDPGVFADADAAITTSAFAADYLREAIGLRCAVLPPLLDLDAVRADSMSPGHVTFFDPTPGHGVYAFARIADELGRRRPDIRLLVVEGTGTEATVVACGLDLRARGTVFFLAPTADPQQAWAATRLAILPHLVWDDASDIVAGALAHGVPLIASDRGSLPEFVGQAGVVLPLPDRLTPATATLPTAEEVAPWVEAIIRLWDDPNAMRDAVRTEAQARGPDVALPQYVEFFTNLRPGNGPPRIEPVRRGQSVVLVPHLNGIDWECEQGLRQLEEAGVEVVRRGGCSAIDQARNELASDALHDGFESLFFIDADIGFEPADVLRLLARPEPVVGGIYAKKGRRELASHFPAGVTEVLFGPDAPGLYPVEYAATGFLCIKAAVLRQMIAQWNLPLCNTHWGRGIWPFFLPLIVWHEGDKLHYLGEDWAFSHRLRQIGVTPLADTSVRLWHYGRHAFGWEDAGADQARYRSYRYRIGGP